MNNNLIIYKKLINKFYENQDGTFPYFYKFLNEYLTCLNRDHDQGKVKLLKIMEIMLKFGENPNYNIDLFHYDNYKKKKSYLFLSLEYIDCNSTLIQLLIQYGAYLNTFEKDFKCTKYNFVIFNNTIKFVNYIFYLKYKGLTIPSDIKKMILLKF